MSASLANLVRHTINIQRVVTCVGSYGGTVVQQPVRFASNKHYNPKGRKYRRKKYAVPFMRQILDYKQPDMDTPDKIRMHMKQHGLLQRTMFNDPIDITCTSETFDQYLPPEGDGKSSLLSLQKGKDVLKGGFSKGRNFKDRRLLKEYETSFNEKSFAEMAQSQLIKTYTLLQDVKSNENELHQLVTNFAYPKLVFGLEFKTFRWKFVESIEPPRVVHVRTSQMLTDENLYGQVTVRCHTKQILSIYDRFGRLMYGSETVPRDVLEYIVFEKHIVNVYGEWRMHSKITPKWLPPQAPQINTQIKPDLPDREELERKINELSSGDKVDQEEDKNLQEAS